MLPETSLLPVPAGAFPAGMRVNPFCSDYGDIIPRPGPNFTQKYTSSHYFPL